uniref:RNA-binding S4 domain-containing protein n=1 Tax=Phaeomonas parva TaxID=124430 RepID=A0A7S1UHB6_9STRA|mmetsp:Transcript_5693/g.15978  ORF Transcript_5693/g.15978 Transcript_5693/m.15978 type:complete len:326 (+) Transcript_5693:59-1036(+)
MRAAALLLVATLLAAAPLAPLGLAKGPKAKPERIDKILSQRFDVSRAQARTLIMHGKVTVAGAAVRSPKDKFDVDVDMEVTGLRRGTSEDAGPPRPQTVKSEPTDIKFSSLLLAYHKPVGVLSTLRDPQGRRDLTTELPGGIFRRFHPVGRLDADTSGLLLLSSDGDLTHRLLHPKHNVEREYIATIAWPRPEDFAADPTLTPTLTRVEGAAAPKMAPSGSLEELRERLAAGVVTTEGTFSARVVDGEEGWRNTKHGENVGWVQLAVAEGKYRMVRRVLMNAGHEVLGLHRVRYGGILLNDLRLPENEVTEVPQEMLGWAEDLLG